MKNFGSKCAAHVAVSVMLAALCSGCERHEGPAEQAGKELDQAATRIGKTLEQAGDDLQDAAHGKQ